MKTSTQASVQFREIVEKEGTKVKEMQAPLQVSDYFSFSEVESLIYTEVGTLTGPTKDMTAGLYVCR